MITVDPAKCNRCGFCLEVCPNYVFAVNSDVTGKVEAAHPEQCCVCGHCVAICPENAIHHKEIPITNFRALLDTELSPESMRSILLSRRSIRTFKEEAVPKELLEQLVETGIHAGTSSNGQTADFVIIQDRGALSELEQLVIEVLWNGGLRYLGSRLGRRLIEMRYGSQMARQYMAYHHIIKDRKNRGQLRDMVFRNAPVVIANHGIRTNFLAHTNCAIAIRNMEIMALSMGLGTCWVGFLTSAAHISKKIGKYLGITPNRNIYGAIMVGYPKHRYATGIPRRGREVRWI